MDFANVLSNYLYYNSNVAIYQNGLHLEEYWKDIIIWGYNFILQSPELLDSIFLFFPSE